MYVVCVGSLFVGAWDVWSEFMSTEYKLLMLMKYIYYHTKIKMGNNSLTNNSLTFKQVNEEIEKTKENKEKLLKRRKEVEVKIDTRKKEIWKL